MHIINRLRNITVLAMAVSLCLSLTACAPNAEKAGASATGAAESAASGYAVILHNTEITPGAEMSAIVRKLGEPKKYFESESCAYQGLDKVYTYDGAVITTYPDKETDRVLSIELKDDTAATAEGLSIGDNRGRVTDIYGEKPISSADSSVSYVKGNSLLSFIFDDDGSVTSITCTLASKG